MQISRTGAQRHSEVNLFYTKPVTNSQISKEHDSKEDGAGLMYRNLPDQNVLPSETIFKQRLNNMRLFIRFIC